MFTLMLNNGKMGNILYAQDRLRKRLKAVANENIQKCIDETDAYFKDPENELMDSDFTRNYTKFAANKRKYCTQKYLKDLAPTLFDVKKTHNVFINSQWKPFANMAYTYIKATNPKGVIKFGNEVTFELSHGGLWVADMVLHVTLENLTTTSPLDKVKYADLLGHRLLESVKLMIDEKVIAEYGTEDLNVHYNFKVTQDKKDGWLRNIGQEIPHNGFLTTDPAVSEVREYKRFADGAQTLKRTHSKVDMWISNIFWFNDVRQALTNGKLPYGRTKISYKLRDINDLVSSADYGGGGGFTAPTISTFDLYVNNIEASDDLRALVIAQPYEYNLVRVNKQFTRILNQPTGSILLKELKFPVETIFCAIRPLENLENVDIWHRNTKLTKVLVKTPVIVSTPNPNTISINSAVYFTEQASIDNCSLRVSDIPLYQTNPIGFYSGYLPYVSNGFTTPCDQGWLLFNFAFQNEGYDPSGHLDTSNISSSNREVYFDYDSTVIDNNNRARMYIIAQTLNFFLIKNETAIIRYVT